MGAGWCLGALIFLGLSYLIPHEPNAAIDAAFPGDPGREGELEAVVAGVVGRLFAGFVLTFVPALAGRVVGRRQFKKGPATS
jgi:hypothetical protein